MMKFFDAQGVAIPTAEPVIAIMVGRTPMLGDSVPIAASHEPGAQVPCPQSVIDDVRKRFEQACATDQRRDQAARDQKTSRDAVDKSCSDMAVTLGGRVKPTP
jgi:hypothetical protein